MSTATAVPVTHHLTGDDAGTTLRETGRLRLAKDSVTRFVAADGTSHTRALAHVSVLTLVPTFIALIGLVTTPRMSAGREVLEGAIRRLG